MTSLAELFPDGDHRFRLTLRHAEPRDYFAPHDASGAVLAERARWLAAEPARYAAMRPEAAAPLAEFAALAGGWSGIRPPETADAALRWLGRSLEPDILFLAPDAGGEMRLRGGALCFPTGWALEEKLGQPLDAIHGAVPGLDAALGAPIRRFLARLRPGAAYLRDNWGLAGTDELNLHPARGLPPPLPPVALDRLWLRVEHQALLALPESGGIVFAIRIARHRLDAVVAAGHGPALRRALESMPAALAEYKRIASVREELARRL